MSHDSEVLLEFDRLYLKEATQHMIGLKRKLNALLNVVFIFAGLFSAINAAVLALSVPDLSNNPVDETNRLLRLLILQHMNASYVIAADLAPPPFYSSQHSININRAFSASLICAILASLGALMAMRWLTYFELVDNGTPEDQRLEIQRKLDGASWWHLSSFVASLSSLLELTVILFTVAWVGFLHGKNYLVGYPNNGLAWFGLALITFPILFALWDVTCPFHTPVSRTIIPNICKGIHNTVFCSFSLLRRGIAGTTTTSMCHWHLSIIAIGLTALQGFRRVWYATCSFIWTFYHFLRNRRGESDDIIDLKSICWAIENASDRELLRAATQRISTISDNQLDFIIRRDTTVLLQKRFLYLYRRNAIHATSQPSDGFLYGHAIMHLLKPRISHDANNITIISGVLAALEDSFGFRWSDGGSN